LLPREKIRPQQDKATSQTMLTWESDGTPQPQEARKAIQINDFFNSWDGVTIKSLLQVFGIQSLFETEEFEVTQI
jgi:hypothetical protein